MALIKLVDSAQLDADLTSVANAIRTKSGGSSQLAFPSGFISEIGNIPSGGGGATETLLASGTYTQSTDNTNLVIPVTISGSFTKITKVFVLKDSVTSDVGQTLSWFKLYDTPAVAVPEFDNVTELHVINASGGYGYQGRSNITITTPDLDSVSAPTQLTCIRASNNFHVKADTYHWYIWGLA